MPEFGDCEDSDVAILLALLLDMFKMTDLSTLLVLGQLYFCCLSLKYTEIVPSKGLNKPKKLVICYKENHGCVYPSKQRSMKYIYLLPGH